MQTLSFLNRGLNSNSANYSASYETLGNFLSLSKSQPLNRQNDKRTCIIAQCMAHDKCPSLFLAHQLLHRKNEHLCSSQFFGLCCQWLGARLPCLFVPSLTLCAHTHTFTEQFWGWKQDSKKYPLDSRRYSSSFLRRRNEIKQWQKRTEATFWKNLSYRNTVRYWGVFC